MCSSILPYLGVHFWWVSRREIYQERAILRLLWIFAGGHGPSFRRYPKPWLPRHGGPWPHEATSLGSAHCYQEKACPLWEARGVAGPGADHALAGGFGAASGTWNHPGKNSQGVWSGWQERGAGMLVRPALWQAISLWGLLSSVGAWRSWCNVPRSDRAW